MKINNSQSNEIITKLATMKNYLKYLSENPGKLVLPILITLFFVAVNVIINYKEVNLALSIPAAIFSAIVVFVINIQVWGEYKQIEGFIPTIKALFKWK
jgi:hypothetical protein